MLQRTTAGFMRPLDRYLLSSLRGRPGWAPVKPVLFYLYFIYHLSIKISLVLTTFYENLLNKDLFDSLDQLHTDLLLKSCQGRQKLLQVGRTTKSCSRRLKLLKSCRAQSIYA